MERSMGKWVLWIYIYRYVKIHFGMHACGVPTLQLRSDAP